MRRYTTKLGLISTSIAIITLLGATASALPSSSANQASLSAKQAADRLRLCQNRERVIDQILTRINTRATNQITLFNGIATKVEAFYVKKGKTVSDYSTLTAAISAATTQAQNDLATLKSDGNFTCSVSDPRAIVTGFQAELKLEISDLQSLRTAVKNLIVAVAQANGSKLSSTATSSGSGQ